MKSRTSLLVEDNPADINLVEEALEEANFDCCLHIMRDGVRAFEFLERLDAEADCPAPDVDSTRFEPA